MTFEVEEQYQQFGLVHLLAISGSHIVLLMVIVYFILLRSGVKGGSDSMSYLLHSSIYDFSRSVTICYKSSITGVFMLIAFMCSIRLSSLDAFNNSYMYAYI